VARDAGLATRTVQEYYQILEDTLIGFRLPAWQRSERARMVAHPRFHLFDTGITNALCRRLGAPVDGSLRGRLFEQWLVLECWRTIDNREAEARLFFWRTNHGAEVDLLIERHGRLVLAAEIKARPHVSGADLSGLRSFAEAHPDVPRMLVCEAPESYQLHGTRVMPYREFLARLPRLVGRG
ncbi:MAG: DUF4143 domain-containing protein, partial [Vicinamibacteria bacterium]|nr:DUF4143 domain-containing protein [Vicinamibacteria bacterium]